MSMLREMQAEATDDKMPLSSLLRRAILLSQRLSYPALREWAQHELGGYPSDAQLPSYRAWRPCMVYAQFVGPGGATMTDRQVPSSTVRADLREQLFGYSLRDSIAIYEAMVPDGARFPWDANVVAHYQDRLMESWTLVAAHRVIGPGTMPALLDAVRTRLLTLALEIELIAPDAGEVSPGESGASAHALDALYVSIVGDNNVVAAASPNATQTVNLDQSPTWQATRADLSALGVPDQDLIELQAALERDGDPTGALGTATASWYAKVRDKIHTGTIVLAGDVGAAMIADRLLAMLGLR